MEVLSIWSIWQFPEIGVPPHHPFKLDFPFINHPYLGYPYFRKPPYGGFIKVAACHRPGCPLGCRDHQIRGLFSIVSPVFYNDTGLATCTFWSGWAIWRWSRFSLKDVDCDCISALVPSVLVVAVVVSCCICANCKLSRWNKCTLRFRFRLCFGNIRWWSI